MANIKVELSHDILDGQPVTFVAPCDCTAITGLKVTYPGGSKEFTFKDAHGNVLTGIGNLFTAGAYVKAILDVTGGSAYLQNADTNAYLEAQFARKAPTGFGLGVFDDKNAITKEELDNPKGNGWRYINTVEGSLDWLPTKVWGVVEVVGLNSKWCRETVYDWNMGYIFTRTQHGTDGWGPWEWANPPMVPGVEYRTTERYNGKPVYTRKVNMAALGASYSAAGVAFSTEPSITVISLEGIATYNGEQHTFPVIRSDTNGVPIARLTVAHENGSYRVYSRSFDTDMTGWSAIITIKYIKD